jgi:hypothetical protein
MDATQTGASYAVLVADVIASRAHRDQSALIGAVTGTLDWVNQQVEAVQPLAITVGDAFQGAYRDLAAALDAALLTRLRLTTRYDVRFGLGWGEISAFDPERAPMAQSGSAWWAAREAIDRVVEVANKQQWPRSVRTLVAGVPEPLGGALNAFLLCRDALLGRMDDKDLRITLGLFLGERQADIAAELDITQPSVARRQMGKGASAVYQAHLAARTLAA